MNTGITRHPFGIALVAIMLIIMLVVFSGCDEDTGSGAIEEGAITVPGDYSSIQGAIDAADDGDVIVVSTGTYNENINFEGKNITLRSTDPEDRDVREQTVIDGGRTGSVVTFENGESEEALISGFTITGGGGKRATLEFTVDDETREEEAYYGGGMIIMNESSPTVENNTFVKNVA